MLARTLARVAAALPSSVKYKMSKKMRPLYTSAMSLLQPVIEVRTAARGLHWRIDRQTRQGYVLGTYEPYMQKSFLRLLPRGVVVYDIGAHADFHSLFCGLLVGSSGRVISFEPNPAARESFQRQAGANPSIPVSVLPYAVSDRCGILALATSRWAAYVTKDGDLDVEARTIDYLVSGGYIPSPYLMKIDVEDHEEQVIRGSMDTVQRYRPIVLCDNNDWTTLPTVARLLTPLAYRISYGPPIVALSGT